jgi:hypothetical protein
MRLQHLGSNQVELQTNKARILFSYNTPVAAYVYGRGYVRTRTYYSRTTSKHINAFLCNAAAEEVVQAVIDGLLDEAQEVSHVR